MRARFYNPVTGRFTQEDIYRGDGLNLYVYCGNNPVKYYDPSGFEKVSMHDTVKEIKARNNGQVVVGVDEHSIVFRVIRKDELDTIEQVIIPKNINDKKFTPEDHVANKNNSTSYNSTTINIAKAERWAKRTNNDIVSIDLSKLPDNQKIVDLTTDNMRKVRLNGNETAMKYAKQSSEVLTKGQINGEAVKVLSKSDIEAIKKIQSNKLQ